MAASTGHGWIGGRNGTTPLSSYYGQISAESEITYIFRSFRIAAMNPSNGVYNFSAIGAELDYLNTQGGTKKLRLEIPLKKFAAIANAPFWVPPWWGARDVAWSAASNGSSILIRLDNPTIRGYVLDFYDALGNYLAAHPHVSLIDGIDVGSETALSNPYDANGNPISISTSTWQASYEALMSGARSRLTGFSLRAKCNGFSLVSQTQYIENILGYGIDEIGSPDTEPYKQNDLANHNRMLTMAQYAADCIIHHNVEDGNYNITCVPPADYVNPTYASTTLTKTTAGSAMMKFFIDAHVNYYKTAKLSWLNSQYSTAGSDSTTIGNNIKTAIAAYGPGGFNTFPVISTTEPPVEPPVSSTSFTFKPVQTTIPTSGTPPVALPVAHSLPATPKMFFGAYNKATANETNASGLFSFGASDFTNEWLVAFRSNVANPTTTRTYAVTNHSGGLSLPGSDNLDYSFNDGTPDATNINLSVDNVAASAYLANLFAGTGDGLLRFVGTAALSTQDTAVPITATDPTTGATFQPNAAIVVTINTTFGAGFVNHALMSFGIACVNNSSATVQKCVVLKNENGVSPSEPALKLHTTRVGSIINTSDAEAFTVDLAFTSTGCTVTAKGGDGTGSSVAVILMQLKNADMDLVDITFPTATGDANHNIGGYLDFGMMIGTVLDTVDSIDTTNAASFFISSFTPTVALANANSFEDNQATADDRGRTAQKPVYLLAQDGSSVVLGATYVGQNGTDLTLNYSAAPGTAYKGFLWRVYKPSVLSVTVDPVSVPTTIDLSNYTDYSRLGIGSATGIERKADGGQQISVTWNNAPTGVFTGGSTKYPQFSATNSAPSGALAASAARPYWGTVGDIVTITAPAGVETSNILAWINASGVDIDLTVSISDGSVSDFTDTISSADTTSGNIKRILVDSDYVASLDGETITITAEITVINAAGGNMSVQAVALTNNYAPPADIQPPSLVFGYPTLRSMTETSPGSGLYDVAIDVQLSEAGEVFAQGRKQSNTDAPTSQQVEAGTDGADSVDDIEGTPSGNVDIDFLETVTLTVSGLAEGNDYWIDVGAKDAAGNYMIGAYSLPITTPEAATGGGGGPGIYSATTGIIRSNGNAVTDTAIVYSWVEDDVGEYSTSTFVDGTGTTSSTGTFTITRPTTNQGRIIISDAATGTKIWTEVLTPA